VNGAGATTQEDDQDDLLDSPLLERRVDFGKRIDAVKREMMTLEELAAYDALPESFLIHRGCYVTNKWGLSWSQSREIAEEFPTLGRYRQPGQALLVTARVKKSEVIAIKLDRDENEIVTMGPMHISTRHIKG